LTTGYRSRKIIPARQYHDTGGQRVRFVRRLGRSPQELDTTTNKTGSPDIWELEDGSFAIIGVDRTDELIGYLPAGAGVGTQERILVLPRVTLTAARVDIPIE
jgi:hypothetical protein